MDLQDFHACLRQRSQVVDRVELLDAFGELLMSEAVTESLLRKVDHVRKTRPGAKIGGRTNAADPLDAVGVAKGPTVTDQTAVALHHQPGPRIEAVALEQLFVELLADCGGCGAAARRSHVDAGDVKTSRQQLVDVKPMLQPAVPIVDLEPEREDPHPAFLRIDFFCRLYDVRHAIVDAQLDQFARGISAGDCRGNHLPDVFGIGTDSALLVGGDQRGNHCRIGQNQRRRRGKQEEERATHENALAQIAILERIRTYAQAHKDTKNRARGEVLENANADFIAGEEGISMSAPMTSSAGEGIATAPSVNRNRQRGVWIPLVLVALFWCVPFVAKLLDLPIYAGFFSSVGSVAVLILAFSAWWLYAGAARLRDRVLIWLSLIAIAVVVSRLVDKSIGGLGLLFFGLPAGLSAVALWLVLSRNRAAALRQGGMLAAFAIVCGSTCFVRVNGIDGDQHADVRWRWSTTSEDSYLASRSASVETKPTVAASRAGVAPSTLVAQPGDWTEFRGPDRRGEVRGLKIATDWESHPPKQLWRQRIGPAWSSMLIIGNRLFTQEQRGDSEVVVCLDAATGHEIWAINTKQGSSTVRPEQGRAPAPRFPTAASTHSVLRAP